MLIETPFDAQPDFWPQFARWLVTQLDAHHGTAPAQAKWQVVLPLFAHQKLLRQAFAASEHAATATAFQLSWMQGLPHVGGQLNDSRVQRIRTQRLFAIIRELPALQTVFLAHRSPQQLALAQHLAHWCHDLVQASMRITLDENLWRHTLSRWWVALEKRLQTRLSDEAELIWRLWQQQMEQENEIELQHAAWHQLANDWHDQPQIWLWSAPPPLMFQAYAARIAAPVHSVALRALDDLQQVLNRSTLESTAVEPSICLKAFADVPAEVAAIAADCRFRLQTQPQAQLAVVTLDRAIARRLMSTLRQQGVAVVDEVGWRLDSFPAATLVRGLLQLLRYERTLDWVSVLSTLRLVGWSRLAQLSPSAWQQWGTNVWQAPQSGALESLPADTRKAIQADWRQWQRTLQTATQRCLLSKWAAHILSGLQQMDLLPALSTLEGGAACLKVLQQWSDGSAEESTQAIGMLSWDECLDYLDWDWGQRFVPEIDAPNAQATSAKVHIVSLAGAQLRDFDALWIMSASEGLLAANANPRGALGNEVRRELGLRSTSESLLEHYRTFVQLVQQQKQLTFSYVKQEGVRVAAWLAPLSAQLVAPIKESDKPVINTALRHAAPRPQSALMSALLPTRLAAQNWQDLSDCPFLFYARSGLGLSLLRVQPQEESSERDYGIWGHQLLEQFHRTAVQPILPSDQAVVQPLADEAEIAQLQQQLGQLADQFFSTQCQQQPDALRYQVRFQKVALTYPQTWWQHSAAGWQVHQLETKYQRPLADLNLLLHGKPDRIDRRVIDESAADPQTQWAIVDYKSKSSTDLKQWRKTPPPQLAFYALLLATADDAAIIPHDVRGYYVSLTPKLKGSKQTWPQELSNSAVEIENAVVEIADLAPKAHALEVQIKHTWRALQMDVPARALGLESRCRYCEMRGLCRKY